MTNTNSAIQWTDATWNPVTGCSRVSDGCRYCYAESISRRFKHTTKPWSFINAAENVVTHPERLSEPLHWRKPRRVFVNSMSDLFHERVPDAFILECFDTMMAAPQHTYQILTKRPERMRDFMLRYGDTCTPIWYYLPRIWLGVSVEDQRAADERIPLLLQTPAAVRFLSCEPLLGPVNLFDRYFSVQDDHGEPSSPRCNPDGTPAIGWVIIGGESGPHARPMNARWAESLVAQCREADVSVFMKQLGTVWAKTSGMKDRHGGDIDEWPADLYTLKVREFPAVGVAQ